MSTYDPYNEDPRDAKAEAQVGKWVLIAIVVISVLSALGFHLH